MDDSNEIITLSPGANDTSSLPPLDLEDLPAIMQAACANAGWTSLTPVQRYALPYMLKQEDIMVQSRTGSGKTGTYLLPMLSTLNPEAALPQALILTPTRELAVQVEKEANRLFAAAGFKVIALYGGVGYEKQLAALRQGASIIIGTPGRILDHLLRRSLRLDQIQMLVFDEADRMLSIGFYPDMKQIQRYLPQTPIHATLFSATYPPHVLRLAGEFLQKPTLLSLSGEQIHVAEVQHAFCECSPMEKDRVLLRLIEIENPSSAIIFCNTKANVHFVTAVLQGFGLNADELSADLNQKQREAVLDRLRKGQLRLLVATDVAARGIDIPELSHVFLYEPPEDRESYIHRAGRTGRAGAAGMVISLVDVMQHLELKRIAQFYKIPLAQIPAPSEEEADKALGCRVLTLLESQYRKLNGLEKERIARLESLARALSEDAEHTPLMAMLIDSAYQQCLNPKDVLPAKAGPEGSQAQGKEKARRRSKRTTKAGGALQEQPV
ncbi:MAG: DEAD/DEAH box helicase, partial [Desulfovibrionaceae bacterium]|nr:DEAD/DEAH box helicase [Desulfovibrionaceae bacterium]